MNTRLIDIDPKLRSDGVPPAAAVPPATTVPASPPADLADLAPGISVNDTVPVKTAAPAKKEPKPIQPPATAKKVAPKEALPAKNVAAKKARVAAKKVVPVVAGSVPKRPATSPSTVRPKAVAPLKSTTETAGDNTAVLPPSPTTKLKDKLVRDSFTMPQADFALIAVLKDRALGFRRPTKKSELLRAGLQVLNTLTAAELSKVLSALSPLKAGRPKKKVALPQ